MLQRVDGVVSHLTPLQLGVARHLETVHRMPAISAEPLARELYQ